MENKGSIFTSVEKKRQKRSNFNLSHDLKISMDMGKLIPTYLQEIIPGDKIKINTSHMMRLAPLISPVMHKIDIYQEYFFVPNRILWSNWETFITGSRNGKQLTQDEMPAFPTVQPYAMHEVEGEQVPLNMLNGTSSLLDYLGLPTYDQFPGAGTSNLPTIPGITKINALPFAAYQRVYDEYYRDENLITSMYDVDDPSPWENYNQLQDGVQDQEIQQQLAGMRVRAWQHDYFTSALPWAQKGEEVRIPVDLKYNTDAQMFIGLNDGDSNDLPLNTDLQFQATEPPIASTDDFKGLNVTTPNGLEKVSIGSSKAYQNQSTINDLRAAIKLQEWLETNARGGSRYFESIYAHFGVQSPDSRLQRPEYIGSSRSNMTISEVMQTSSPQTENDTPQGNLSGQGMSVNNSKTFSYTAQEHGYIIGITSVMPNTAYQQGIPKHFRKISDRLQYYFPEFAHLGEQEVYNYEIYAANDQLSESDPFGTFGYVPRYSEYKFINSRVAGDFRDTLDFWHLGRKFEVAPKLNDFFIGSNPSKRVFAVQDLPQDGETGNKEIRNYDSIYAHIFHDVKASRLMPKYGTPTI